MRFPFSASMILAVSWFLLVTTNRVQGGDRPGAQTPIWVGSGSCAATACHSGRREPRDLKGSEYLFSEAYDPHVRAYSVLFEDRSKTIEKNYRRLANLDASRPFEDDACLRCHVNQGYDSKATHSRAETFAIADGVNCEGCHGAAGNWLVPHVESGWKALTEVQKRDGFGLRPTKNLLARGQICTECHVGVGSTDVNHDLIAAGHPRLNFEYGSQLAKLPKHWRMADDKARHPDYEAKIWALGQLLSAKAAVDLLESRATRSTPDDSTTPWPEFAEYSCFSCHHELTRPGWPSASQSRVAPSGKLPWGTWYLPLARSMPRGFNDFDVDQASSPVSTLRELMKQPIPEAVEVAKQARGISAELGRMMDRLNRNPIAPGEVKLMLSRTLSATDPGVTLDWDRAARHYLALVALDKAATEFDPRFMNASVKASLDRLLTDLNLPREVSQTKTTFDSPFRFDPVRIKGEFQSVQAALPSP